MRYVVALAASLFLTCTGQSEFDQLGKARARLHSAGCGSEPMVAGVAGVNEDPRKVYLDDWIVVSVCHLDELMRDAAAQQQPITLFIEGVDTGNGVVGVDRESGTLTFVLDRNDKNKELWSQFLYDPLFEAYVTMRVSVGVHGDKPLLKTPGANLSLNLRKLYVDSWTWLWLGLLLIVAVVLIIAARRTDMLREGPPIDGVRQQYSLPKSQMAWWFFLTLVSYVYIWLVTGDRDTITPSLLGLMGISAATALAGVAVAQKMEGASRGWWRDLVTDETGAVALDHLQIVVWTWVLGGIFLTSVIWHLTMPEFSVTMLALMGISSGTYIGFKLPAAKS